MFCQGVAAEAEGGVFAQVQSLADLQGAGVFGREVGEFPVADDAAEVHVLLLAVGVALPVVPAQVFVALHLRRLCFERAVVGLRGDAEVDLGGE